MLAIFDVEGVLYDAEYLPLLAEKVNRENKIWEITKETGHRNGFLPVLIPESLLSKEKKHFEGFNPEVFWVTHSGNSEIGDRLALRPTSETLAYSLFSQLLQELLILPL